MSKISAKSAKTIARHINSLTVWQGMATVALEEKRYDDYRAAANARDDAIVELYHEFDIVLPNTDAVIQRRAADRYNVEQREIKARSALIEESVELDPFRNRTDLYGPGWHC
jgi:hypothetical protein